MEVHLGRVVAARSPGEVSDANCPVLVRRRAARPHRRRAVGHVVDDQRAGGQAGAVTLAAGSWRRRPGTRSRGRTAAPRSRSRRRSVFHCAGSWYQHLRSYCPAAFLCAHGPGGSPPMVRARWARSLASGSAVVGRVAEQRRSAAWRRVRSPRDRRATRPRGTPCTTCPATRRDLDRVRRRSRSPSPGTATTAGCGRRRRSESRNGRASCGSYRGLIGLLAQPTPHGDRRACLDSGRSRCCTPTPRRTSSRCWPGRRR